MYKRQLETLRDAAKSLRAESAFGNAMADNARECMRELLRPAIDETYQIGRIRSERARDACRRSPH